MLQSYSVKKDEIFHTNSCMKQFCGYAKLPFALSSSYSVKKDEIFHTNSCMKQFCGYAKLPLVISYSVKKDVIFKYIGV